MIKDFVSRHIGVNAQDEKTMLNAIGETSLDALINKTVPSNIRLKNKLVVDEPLSEYEYLQHVQQLAKKNLLFKTYIGLGYYSTITPSVILRNIFENPGWYTAYTPYQAEIAQGRLEALLNYQTLITDLTGMELANASLLDESTAAAEAMHMFYAMRTKEQVKNKANKLFVDQYCFPQTIDVLKTRSAPQNIELVMGNPSDFKFGADYFGAIIQYPNSNGEIIDYANWVSEAKEASIFTCFSADIMSLVLITPPGEWGVDAVVGTTQRFGVPMGYGGPHAAYFATKEEYKRFIPGRIIGVSVDAHGNRAMRMALQTREQHIKRDKATSNICTAQALLAIMASMYAVYHGPKGLKEIAGRIHAKTSILAQALTTLGFELLNRAYFDTLTFKVSNQIELKSNLEKASINIRFNADQTASISIDETSTLNEIQNLVDVLSAQVGKNSVSVHQFDPSSSIKLKRESKYLTHPVFNSHHSETEMMRYIKKLESKDLALNHSMISLGSCTMKLNAASELIPCSIAEFANLHPFVPIEQAAGYLEMLDSLNKYLCEVTGFTAMSFQPNSGAQGEYTGLMVIRAYHQNRNDFNRNIALIPSSAHGTNPASAVMAGMNVVVVKCDDEGNVDVADLKQKAELHKDNLSCLMVTYPSTHGVYEASIMTITQIIHDNGGLVYMDGANMNAQVGLTSPGNIGADVCHLNLHKTFAIPHGGGGPGMGPIGVNDKLKPFLPGHSLISTGGEKAIHAVSATPFGSTLILLISYGYIKMLGGEGLTLSTKFAILNANYIKVKLAKHYPILYAGNEGTVAHELILDCREFKKTANVEVADIAKRLMDYGFHAPTVSFPVPGTIMVEPTESENLAELDRFCEAMISIRNEIAEIETGIAKVDNNVIINAPHTANVATSDDWIYPYTRLKAIFPLEWVRENKFWPSVGKIDNAFGDRNLQCTCPPIENYQTELIA